MIFADLYKNVVEQNLCTRCGICAGICPVSAISLGSNNFPALTGDCIDCMLCIKSCPGADVDFPLLSREVFHCDYNPVSLQGHVEKTFVAHASDNTIRTSGTSGGLVTALLINLLNNKTIDGAVVTGFSADDPCRMKGILATTPEEIMNAAKSKYCLSSSMDALQIVRRNKGRFAVVGLPCQVHGLRKLRISDPSLGKKIYCIFGLYCHCNMEPYVQYDILKSRGIDPAEISKFDFRGGLWPGGFHIVNKDDKGIPLHTTMYTTILNILFKIYGAPRCYLCVDAVSEYADISFGDFWAQDYLEDFSKLERCTLVSQRTDKGREILLQAEKDGAITLYDLPPDRYSKRIINMARGKKTRNLARIERMNRKGQPVPEYHFNVPAPSRKAKRNELMLRWSFLFRGSLTRKILLKFLFSRAANGYERINLYRKKVFCNYHGN